MRDQISLKYRGPDAKPRVNLEVMQLCNRKNRCQTVLWNKGFYGNPNFYTTQNAVSLKAEV